MAVIEFIRDNWKDICLIVTGAVTIASAIVKLTPSQEDDKILATPTLVKRIPPPLRRIIGDLSEIDKVLLGLDLKSVRDDISEKGE